MQFKTLALVAVAAVAVSAQTFDNNACTQCVFGSFGSDSVCATLNATELTQLESVFTNTTVSPTALAAAVQNPDIKSCVCHWASTAFTATGAAGACVAGTAATCNATQIAEAEGDISGLVGLLSCDAATTNSTTGSNSTAPTTTAAPAPTTAASGSIQMNMPYVLSVAAIGLAALVGL